MPTRKMSRTPYLLLLSLTIVLSQMDDILYCSFRYERLCQGKGQHVACKYTQPGPGEMCENYTAIIFSDDLKLFILHYINRRRQRIASGHERVRGGVFLPKPEIMMLVQWDRELAALAQRLADQCQFIHDDCRATVRYPYAGQTVGEVRWRGSSEPMDMGARRMIRRVFDAWWGERRRVQARQLTSPFLLTARGAVWGHFSQLAVWSLRAMGCGAVHHGISKPRLLLVCDFSHTNMLGQRTISPGPLAPCPLHTARTPRSPYPLLCGPGRYTQEFNQDTDYRNSYRDEEYESEHDESYDTRPKLANPHESDVRRANERSRQKEIARPILDRPHDVINRQKLKEPDELDEDEEEETPRPRPIKYDDTEVSVTKRKPYKLDESDDAVTSGPRVNADESEMAESISDESGKMWRPGPYRPVRPEPDDEMEKSLDLSTPGRYGTKGRTKTPEMKTELSVRYKEDRDNGMIRQMLNNELRLNTKAIQSKERELGMRFIAAQKDNGRELIMRNKGEYKASNGGGWRTSNNPVQIARWSDSQEVIPLRPQSDIADRHQSTIIVYRPTSLVSTEPFVRERWKRPRNRPRRPGENALFQTPPSILIGRQSKASLMLDKEDADQLFQDTGFKLPHAS